jgi:hypothetical protein
MRERRLTLRQKMEARIAERSDTVFLTREFLDLAGERQVQRALKALTDAGQLIRLGYGVYARAALSRLSGQPMLAARGGLLDAAYQMFGKLGIPWEQTDAQRDYNEGRSTQVPVNPAVKLTKSRFARRLRYQDMELRLDRA